MKKKVFIYYIILIIVGVTITGFFISELAQKYYKQEVEENLTNAAVLIGHQLEVNHSSSFDNLSKEYSKIMNQLPAQDSSLQDINIRVTFIDFNGKVLGDSEADYRTMENHINRKEVQESLKGLTGKDSRYSKTLKVQLLYIAVPVKSLKIIVRVSMPLLNLKKINNAIWYYTALSILFGLAFTSLLALRFSSQITKPVEKFIEISKEFSSGNYSKRISIRTKDEFKLLGDTFNIMADKLEETIAALLDKNIKVDTILNNLSTGILAVDKKYDIVLINSVMCDLLGIKFGPGVIGINCLSLLKNANMKYLLEETISKNINLSEEISIGISEEKIIRIITTPIRSKDSSTQNNGGIISVQDVTALKKLEKMRTEFVSNVTHELKTPLTSIRGFVETLRAGAIDDRDVAEKFLQIIDIESERLYILINDILQLSEIEMKHNDTNLGYFELKKVITETFEILSFSAEKKGISLIDECDDGIILYANVDRIKQMLINLIDNGIKYNTENGSVTVKGFVEDNMDVIIIKDTGIGISETNLPRIFERFYRVDKGRSRSMGGTGLGLSIVKHIVNLYNGEIKVKSESGKGTEFVIKLPVQSTNYKFDQ